MAGIYQPDAKGQCRVLAASRFSFSSPFGGSVCLDLARPVARRKPVAQAHQPGLTDCENLTTRRTTGTTLSHGKTSHFLGSSVRSDKRPLSPLSLLGRKRYVACYSARARASMTRSGTKSVRVVCTPTQSVRASSAGEDHERRPAQRIRSGPAHPPALTRGTYHTAQSTHTHHHPTTSHAPSRPFQRKKKQKKT